MNAVTISKDADGRLNVDTGFKAEASIPSIPDLAYGVKNYRDSGGPLLPAGQREPGKGKAFCTICRYRIRGLVKHHEAGPHHKGQYPKG